MLYTIFFLSTSLIVFLGVKNTGERNWEKGNLPDGVASVQKTASVSTYNDSFYTNLAKLYCPRSIAVQLGSV